MPGGMGTLGIDWAIMPNPSTCFGNFLSTTEFSIDGGWLNKRKLLSNSRRRNFSFLTKSTPSTAATTSAEKRHAFTKSSCTKGTEAMTILIVVTPRRTSSTSDNSLWCIFRLNSFGSKFRNKRLDFEVLHKLIEMWWLPAPTIFDKISKTVRIIAKARFYLSSKSSLPKIL